jgi:hypothetical protein
MLFYFINENGNVIETRTIDDIVTKGNCKNAEDVDNTIQNLIQEIPQCTDCVIF